jgi:hypothetical protein
MQSALRFVDDEPSVLWMARTMEAVRAVSAGSDDVWWGSRCIVVVWPEGFCVSVAEGVYIISDSVH